MTEFTFAPGEKNIIGDRFSPSVIIFWLKTSIAASSTRIQYTTPNTLFGLIPLGADTKTIPLRNVASVDTSTKFNLGSLVWGVVFLLIGLGCLDSSVAVALVLILVAASNLANTMSAQLDFVNQAGGRNSVKVSILEKDKLMQLAQNIQRLVVALAVGLVTHPIRTLALVFHKLAALAAGLALILALIVWFWYDHSKPDFAPCFWGSIGVIVASILIRAFAEWILERPTRAERRAMKRAAAQETGRVTMRMPVSEEVAAAFESTRDGRRASL